MDSTVGGIDWTSDSSASPDVSRADRLREYYEERIYKPAMVAMQDWRTVVGLLILGLYILMAIIAILGLYRKPSPNQAPLFVGAFENMKYPLGTTGSGIDLLAIIIHSTPDMLIMITAGGVWATGVAVALGTFAGYKGGRTDELLMSFSDFAMSIPGLPLVVVLAFTFSPQNPIFVGVILTINYWAGLGRSLRSQVLTIREDDYVEASRTMGVSTSRILRKDIIPNLMPYITVNFMFAARFVIFSSVGLYFLGVLPIQGTNWGITLQRAIQRGALYVPGTWYWIVVPSVVIALISLSFILLSQGMDRVFNPRVRTRLAGESESEAGETDEQQVTEVL